MISAAASVTTSAAAAAAMATAGAASNARGWLVGKFSTGVGSLRGFVGSKNAETEGLTIAETEGAVEIHGGELEINNETSVLIHEEPRSAQIPPAIDILASESASTGDDYVASSDLNIHAEMNVEK